MTKRNKFILDPISDLFLTKGKDALEYFKNNLPEFLKSLGIQETHDSFIKIDP